MNFKFDNSSPKVLCVDDESINLEILQEALEDDFNLCLVKSAKACFESFIDGYPDVILMDVNMPVMDGFQACKALKQAKETQDIPVIFVSACNRLTETEVGFAIGAFDYITKPFDENVLINTIKKSLL